MANTRAFSKSGTTSVFVFVFKESWETICYKTDAIYEFRVRGQEKQHPHRTGHSPPQLSVFVTSGRTR